MKVPKIEELAEFSRYSSNTMYQSKWQSEEKALATINKYKEAVARNVDIQKHLSETKSYLECTNTLIKTEIKPYGRTKIS